MRVGRCILARDPAPAARASWRNRLARIPSSRTLDGRDAVRLLPDTERESLQPREGVDLRLQLGNRAGGGRLVQETCLRLPRPRPRARRRGRRPRPDRARNRLGIIQSFTPKAPLATHPAHVGAGQDLEHPVRSGPPVPSSTAPERTAASRPRSSSPSGATAARGRSSWRSAPPRWSCPAPCRWGMNRLTRGSRSGSIW